MIGQAPADARVHVFGRYNAVAYLAGAFGALAAGGPAFFATSGPARRPSALAAAVPGRGGRCLVLARGSPPTVETEAPAHEHPLERSRKTVHEARARCSRSTRSPAGSS